MTTPFQSQFSELRLYRSTLRRLGSPVRIALVLAYDQHDAMELLRNSLTPEESRTHTFSPVTEYSEVRGVICFI